MRKAVFALAAAATISIGSGMPADAQVGIGVPMLFECDQPVTPLYIMVREGEVRFVKSPGDLGENWCTLSCEWKAGRMKWLTAFKVNGQEKVGPSYILDTVTGVVIIDDGYRRPTTLLCRKVDYNQN